MQTDVLFLKTLCITVMQNVVFFLKTWCSRLH